MGDEPTLMLESELGLLLLRAGNVSGAKEVVEKGKVAVDELQVSSCPMLVVRRI